MISCNNSDNPAKPPGKRFAVLAKQHRFQAKSIDAITTTNNRKN